MNYSKYVTYFVALGVLLIVTGCPPSYRPLLPVDANNPLKRVAVLPIQNDTNDVDGPEVVRKKMAAALENRSYVVKDLKKTDQLLRDLMGITLGGQLELTTAQQLGETLGVEGVLYGTLRDFNETTLGVVNIRKVSAIFKLVNTMTGQTVWQRGLGVQSEMRMQGNTGLAATAITRATARDKEVQWVFLPPTTTGSQNVGESFLIGLGTKLFAKAFGKYLDRESTELARHVTDNLRWGPGAGAPETVLTPTVVTPKMKMP